MGGFDETKGAWKRLKAAYKDYREAKKEARAADDRLAETVKLAKSMQKILKDKEC